MTGQPPVFDSIVLTGVPINLAAGEEVIWKTIDYAMKNPYLTGITLPVDGGMSLQ